MSAVLGNTFDNQPLPIGDIERRSGLYILGKPRMGKSSLLVNMILQDIQSGHGIFFIDPHGDAITDICNLIAGYPIPYIILDPEDTEKTFGINLLECADITDQKLRNDTYTRAKGVFDKLWKNTFEERPWLQLILQNAIYALIENQGLTLAELPMFFRDRLFRDFVCSNIKYNVTVRDYWLKTFAYKDKRDQEAQMEAAQTRSEIFLGHPYVRDIVGQTKTTLDFHQIIRNSNIVFVKLSAGLSYESKKIIGTILLSELLHAVERRPADNRHQFSIFVDEFQTFAAYQDFSTLITQAPKYGVATTLVHHERYGQLLDDPMIMGATSAIANKVIFQVTGKDASDLAAEFAKDPPVETRFEDKRIISQNPFWDLLRGHDSPQVRTFTENYLKPIKERLEDIHGESEAERLLRTDYLDAANALRLDERLEGVNIHAPDIDFQRGALQTASKSIERAQLQTERMGKLNDESQMLRKLIRALNRIFIAVMEGKAAPYSNNFRKLIAEQTAFVNLSEIFKPVYEIILLLKYGEYFEDDLQSTNYAAHFCHNYPKERRREKYGFPEAVAAVDQALSNLLDDLLNNDIEKIEEITKTRCLNAFKRYGELAALRRFPYVERWALLQQDIKTFVKPLRDLKEMCILLYMPQNHITVRSNQQIERKVPTRTVADMTNEMAQELTELPKYTAYAKILQGSNIWKGKITTIKIPEYFFYVVIGYQFKQLQARKFRENKWKLRVDIEQEIRIRQQNWRPHIQAAGFSILSKKAEDEPPPTRY